MDMIIPDNLLFLLIYLFLPVISDNLKKQIMSLLLLLDEWNFHFKHKLSL